MKSINKIIPILILSLGIVTLLYKCKDKYYEYYYKTKIVGVGIALKVTNASIPSSIHNIYTVCNYFAN